MDRDVRPARLKDQAVKSWKVPPALEDLFALLGDFRHDHSVLLSVLQAKLEDGNGLAWLCFHLV